MEENKGVEQSDGVSSWSALVPVAILSVVVIVVCVLIVITTGGFSRWHAKANDAAISANHEKKMADHVEIRARLEAERAAKEAEFEERRAREARAQEEREAGEARAKEAKKAAMLNDKEGEWRIEGWSIYKKTSPVDDSTNVTVWTLSGEPIKAMLGTVYPRLAVRCRENKTEVFVAWETYLGLEETRMLTRFDSEKATTRNWYISTDNKGAFYAGSDTQFAKKLMQHEKLLVQVTPYGDNQATATFTLKGLTEAIEPLRKSCGW